MSHYRSNLRDLEFNLFEVLGADERMGTGPFAEMDAETARDVLRQFEEVASGPVAASFVDADRNPPVYDPATFSVTLPEGNVPGLPAGTYRAIGWHERARPQVYDIRIEPGQAAVVNFRIPLTGPVSGG